MNKNKAKPIKPTPNGPVQVFFKPRYSQQARAAPQSQSQSQSQQSGQTAKGVNVDYALNSIMSTVRNNINQSPNKKSVMFNGVQLSNVPEKVGRTYPIPKVVSGNSTRHNTNVRVTPKLNANRGVPNRKPSINSDQRIKELMRQREILADILSGYQKLQRERQVIAVEIQSMRNYLSDIQDKLQKSLSTLRTNRHFNKIGTVTTRINGKNLAIAHKRVPAKKTVNVNTIRNGANSFMYKKKWK